MTHGEDRKQAGQKNISA